jgi:O-antigen/teichoic acid export membrane protein
MTVKSLSLPELTESENQGLINQAARSVKWSFLYNIVPRLVTPFSTMILAGLLSPADFGLVAIATFIVALAQIVVEMGLGKAVIRAQENVEEAASVSFWMSLLVSLSIYAVLWLISPWIAQLYANHEVVNVIRVAAIMLPLTALMAVPKSLLRRNMEFNRLFWVYSSFLIIQAVMSVILAFFGFGAWSVIWGQLIGTLATVFITWSLIRWRPKLMIKWAILRVLLGFSIWVMVGAFQEWLFSYADNAIAGVFLGVQGLGIYALGFNIAIVVPNFIAAALSDVAYPTFCKIQNDPAEVGKSLVSLQRLTAAVLFPIAMGIAAIASPAIELLYGQKWAGLGTVVALLVVMPGLSGIWALNDTAYQAIGKPNISAKISGGTLLFLLPLMWMAAPYGLVLFTLARFAAAWLRPLGNIFWGVRMLNVSVKEQFKSLISPFSNSIIMFIVVFLLITWSSPLAGWTGWIKLSSSVLAGMIIYILLTWLTNRELLNQLISSVRRMLS